MHLVILSAVALHLREDDVEKVLEMDAVIAAVARATADLGRGTAQNQPRRRVYPPGGVLNVMFASDPGSGYYGLKTYSIGGGTVRFLVLLYREDGNIVAMVEANRLGAYRTGAASAVAAQRLAPSGPQEVAVIGTGWQARTQVHAISRTLQNAHFRVFGRDAERRSAFVDEIREHLGVRADAAASAEDAVRGAGVIVTITPSATPVIEADWVAEGALVIGAGTNQPHKAELPSELIRRAGTVVVDQLEAARLESGDLITAEASGQFDWKNVVELGAILAGKESGRHSPGEIVVFESHGLALWDIASAALVYEEAVRARLGNQVELFGF